MSEQQALEMCHQATAVPVVILVWVSTIILFLLAGLMMLKSSESYPKILKITIVAGILSAVILVGVILIPEISQLLLKLWN